MNVEPLDDMYELLCQERPEDENVNAGVSDENGMLEFNISGTGSSFTGVFENVEKKIKPVLRFADLWKKSVFNGQIVHFCKIDVEGFEQKVLKGIDFKEFRPWIFIIECTLPGTNIACYDKWEDILLSNGYVYACQYGANRYYVEEQKECLIDGLVHFKRLFWGNDICQIHYQNNYLLNKKRLQNIKNVVIFGAGGYFENYISFYGGEKILAIVDNSKEKQGTEVLNIKIQSPDVIKEYLGMDITVLICCEKTEDIKLQLKEIGVDNYLEYYKV